MGMGTERRIIWQGTLEWIEKNKNPNDTQKQTKHVPCQVSIQPKEGEMDLYVQYFYVPSFVQYSVII